MFFICHRCFVTRLAADQRSELYNKIMQELLNNNDILMYSTRNGGKLVIAEKFIKNIKIYKNMKAIDSKCYLNYLNKLADQYKNTYHHFVNEKHN